MMSESTSYWYSTVCLHIIRLFTNVWGQFISNEAQMSTSLPDQIRSAHRFQLISAYHCQIRSAHHFHIRSAHHFHAEEVNHRNQILVGAWLRVLEVERGVGGATRIRFSMFRVSRTAAPGGEKINQIIIYLFLSFSFALLTYVI